MFPTDQSFARNLRENVFFRSISFILREIVLDVVRFPLWWYGPGLVRAVRSIASELVLGSQRLSLTILVRNLLKPMFGDYTRSGRIISFFMRIIVFVFRLAVMAAWIVLLIGFFAVYLILPAVAVYFLVVHFTQSPWKT